LIKTMNGNLFPQDNKVQREVAARLWARQRRTASKLWMGGALLIGVALLTNWKWQAAAVAVALGAAAIYVNVKDPNASNKVPPLLVILAGVWLFYPAFPANRASLVGLVASLKQRLPSLPVGPAPQNPKATKNVKPATARIGYLQGTSGKPVATLYYSGQTKSGKADCSPFSRVLSLPPGVYRVRIEGVRQSVVAREREITIQPGRLTSIGPDK
jgi:hypothetical protein